MGCGNDYNEKNVIELDDYSNPKIKRLFDLGIWVAPGKKNFINSNYRKIPKAMEFIDSLPFPELSVPGRLYMWTHDMSSVPLCRQCKDKQVKFINLSKGFRDYCSVKCMSLSESVNDKKKETCKKNHGVDFSFQNKSIREKMKERIREIYGVDNVSQNQEIKKKKRETELSNYARHRGLGEKATALMTEPEILQNEILKTHPKLISEETGIDEQALYYRIKECKLFNPHRGRSSVECEIAKFLVDNGIVYEQDKLLPSRQELDFYIPEFNLAIEYDGLYWHSDARRIEPLYHLNKTLESESIGIELLHIFENEWLTDKEFWKSFILEKCKKKESVVIYSENIFWDRRRGRVPECLEVVKEIPPMPFYFTNKKNVSRIRMSSKAHTIYDCGWFECKRRK